jgi:DNA-binding FadR family transcriptional regulator
MEQAARRNLEAHEHVVAALTARDPTIAREWMQRHLRDLMRGWMLSGCDLNARVDPGLTY